MINDIDQEVESSRVTSFADDTRISRGMSTKEDSEDLQKDLEKNIQMVKRKQHDV